MDYVAYIAFLDSWEVFSLIPFSHLRQTILSALLSRGCTAICFLLSPPSLCMLFLNIGASSLATRIKPASIRRYWVLGGHSACAASLLRVVKSWQLYHLDGFAICAAMSGWMILSAFLLAEPAKALVRRRRRNQGRHLSAIARQIVVRVNGTAVLIGGGCEACSPACAISRD